MVKNWIFYILGLAGAVVFHAYYFGWFSWFLLQLMVLLPLLSFLLSLAAMLQARVVLDVQKSCNQHEATYVMLRTCGGFLPLPYCRFLLSIRHAMSGHSVPMRQSVTGRDSWYVRIDTAHVGLLSCSIKKAWVYDYLKLFRIPLRTCEPVEVLVEPLAEEPAEKPNLSRFLTKQLRPKPGGGFSEEHEMRAYRPGDPLRSVHWKLSAKTEDLIIREAQEPVRGKVLLTMDLAGTQEQIDTVMNSFLWLSTWLLKHDTVHTLMWIRPSDCQLMSAQITDEVSLHELLEVLLQTPLHPDTPSIAERRFSGVDWQYHIRAEQEASR